MSNAGEGDKRKVSTDALETLGNIIGESERRDAIHLAVNPTQAKETLRPGDHVTADGRLSERGASEAVGIVDPFLSGLVRAGQRFWLVVYPRQIHSLRHVWTHPAFPDVPEVAGEAPKLHADKRAESEAWLREFCKRSDCPGYETVMAAIQNQPIGTEEDYGCASQYDDEYLHFNGYDAHGEIPPEFWDHVEIVLGKPPAYRSESFSCSC